MLRKFHGSASTAEVAEESTRALLRLLGWTGSILHSSRLPARPERSQRLADLAVATGARGYLCGTGGMRYLATDSFADHGLDVVPFVPPVTDVWQDAREVSAVRALMTAGIAKVTDELQAIRSCHRSGRCSA
ncbi:MULTISPECIES: WbqC family protein [Streptomyces]|uniref:WbqC family protein n=1 Tax=Streptomyces changanensis TaxID=2964669 RepID=A0ABY5NDC7_9ACTN|nr:MULTISPECIES: WbqC family protein [Streptomyces]UUS34031.1 WbqC family protein [Streptomyces changanensis]